MKLIKSFLFSLFTLLPQLSYGDLPDVVIETPIGEQLDLKEFQGKPVIITLWASWCGPCLTKLPTIAYLQARYPNTPILAISIDKKPLPPILDTLNQNGINLKHVYWDQHNSLATSFGSNGIPFTIAFDKTGTEVARITRMDESIENHPKIKPLLQ